jgi:lipoyl-dependent peroxiredoxin
MMDSEMKRRGTAHWEGDLNKGRGHLSTGSGLLIEGPYSFATRFADEKGTNPEELIAAAHAGCFSMAMTFALSKIGVTARRIDTRAEISIAMDAGGPQVRAIHLSTEVQAEGIDESTFLQTAEEAKKGCLVSRLLVIAPTLDAKLVVASR